MVKPFCYLLLSLMLILGPVLAMAEESSSNQDKMITTPSGLRYIDTTIGDGATAEKGKNVSVHYTGWLNDGHDGHGKEFDSSVPRGSPFEFPLGAGMVIAGWDEGVAGMQVGGKRTLLIPFKLGYGERGAGGAIPPNADLVFDVELLAVK